MPLYTTYIYHIYSGFLVLSIVHTPTTHKKKGGARRAALKGPLKAAALIDIAVDLPQNILL